MNLTVIILGTIIVVLIYILYQYFTTTSKLVSTADLNSSASPITKIASPGNVTYGYSVWIYVNSWEPGSQKTIFSREGNLKLYLDTNSPTLYLDVTMNDGTKKTTTITTNFPIQRWVFIAVSADNQYFDTYIDGKLVISNRIYNGGSNSTPNTPEADATKKPVYLGNAPSGTGWDATAASFNRITTAFDPQTVWSAYMAGNGTTSWNPLSGYNMNLTILQNGLQSSQIKLW
jgi:Concanavalin A-like lectin/glucanases superfamily